MNSNTWVYDICYIYKIINTINDNCYVGGTVNWYNRRKTHFSKLRLNYHGNINLQKEFNIYGKENFQFEILEEFKCSSYKELLSKEQYYIDKLKPIYNISKIAGSNKGYKMSDDVLKIRSEKQSIKIYQLSKNDEIICCWDSAAKAALSLNMSSSHIRDCCRGLRKTHKGFKWKDC